MARATRGGATISEVAAAAGVSRATVSRVMNRRSTVAADIAARVQAVAEELQYRPSDLARGLSLGRTGTVALVVPDLGNPVFQQVVRGAMAAAAQQDQRVLVAETLDASDDEATVALQARRRCDALVLAAPRTPEPELRALLAQVSPVVLTDRPLDGIDAPVVRVDYAHGVHALVDHLVGLGHRHLAVLAGPPTTASSGVRARALEEAARRHGDLRISTIATGSTVEAGHRVADEVLGTRATAALAFNDLVAFGLLARLNEIGVAVPGDISVTGFDDVELARYATPSLTTTGVDQAEIGRLAMRHLAHLTGAPAAPDAASGVLVPVLAVRASTGPVPPPRRLPVHSPGAAGLVQRRAGGGRARWRTEGTGRAVLEGLGTPLARYADGSGMPPVHSRRPHLHPVHSLAGVPVTASSPVDHRHHYGASLAVDDVDGTSYWGGRTFVPGSGPTLLLNHGHQRAEAPQVRHSGASLTGPVTWLDQDGTAQLHEERTLTGAVAPEVEAWALGWRSDLRAPRTTTVTSPAVRGRPGAGYGGLFWRLAGADETQVLTQDAGDERDVHGSTTPWLALTRRHGRSWSSVLLVQDEGPLLPWFVRVSDYVGAGPSVAWSEPLVLQEGATVRLSLTTVVVDRRVDAADAADLAELAVARVRSAREG
ncbi:DUF6807 family protein [Kineococcus arenarius]|uniref:DUF6807 family protein n=1 Tax=Kineococcus sp. SYSU DK007 TaxID=3383128 RepID=UPI003D7D43AA